MRGIIVRLVIVESPYSAATPEGLERNVRYARACVADCLRRGEAPLASHLLYTQAGILRNDVLFERQLGIEAGLMWAETADATIVYADMGYSAGMHNGIHRAGRNHRPVEIRRLGRDTLRDVFSSEVCDILGHLACASCNHCLDCESCQCK